MAADRFARREPRAAARHGFLTEMGALIDTSYGGRVARNFVYEVIAAVRND